MIVCLPVRDRLSCSAIRRPGACTCELPTYTARAADHRMPSVSLAQLLGAGAQPACSTEVPSFLASSCCLDQLCTAQVHPVVARWAALRWSAQHRWQVIWHPSAFPSLGLCARVDVPMVVPHGKPGHRLVHHVEGHRRRHQRVRQCCSHIRGRAALPHWV